MLNSVTVYSLNEQEMYEQHDMKTEDGIVTSKFLEGFSVNLQDIIN